MNENKKYQRKGYWSYQNIGVCYMDMLEDLAQKCSESFLPNYFNERENILANKKKEVLGELEEFALERRSQLVHLRLEN